MALDREFWHIYDYCISTHGISVRGILRRYSFSSKSKEGAQIRTMQIQTTNFKITNLFKRVFEVTANSIALHALDSLGALLKLSSYKETNKVKGPRQQQ